MTSIEPSIRPSPSMLEIPQDVLDAHLSVLRAAQVGDLSNWAAILDLPRRKSKHVPTRLTAEGLSQQLFPDYTPIKAIISYDPLVKVLKDAALEEKQKFLLSQTKKQGRRLIPQGPWKGQEIDPVSLKGPKAMPMPVTIPPQQDFEPIFDFLKRDEDPNQYIRGKTTLNGITPGEELVWNTPMIEFQRGIIYEDGRLDLCKMVTGPTHITALMDSLENNSQVSQFLLGNNIISGTGADRIAKFIESHPDRIETWYLAGGHINTTGLRKLVEAMVKSKKITNVWLKRNPLGEASADLLAELVLKTQNLRTLDLENVELGDRGISRFLWTIAQSGASHSLINIFLNANGMGDKGAEALSYHLDSPQTAIESLFLSTNPLGDAGIKKLVPALKQHKTLKRLSLSSAGLTPAGINELCAALKDHPSLTTLDVGESMTTAAHGQRQNWITGDCALAITTLLQSMNLRFLSLAHI